MKFVSVIVGVCFFIGWGLYFKLLNFLNLNCCSWRLVAATFVFNTSHFQYHSSINSRLNFPIVDPNSSFKPFAISFSAMQWLKKSLRGSYLVTLSLRRLSFSATSYLFLLVAGVFCNEDLIRFESSLTSVYIYIYIYNIYI